VKTSKQIWDQLIFLHKRKHFNFDSFKIESNDNYFKIIFNGINFRKLKSSETILPYYLGAESSDYEYVDLIFQITKNHNLFSLDKDVEYEIGIQFNPVFLNSRFIKPSEQLLVNLLDELMTPEIRNYKIGSVIKSNFANH
jgi:phage terminase large subunit